MWTSTRTFLHLSSLSLTLGLAACGSVDSRYERPVSGSNLEEINASGMSSDQLVRIASASASSGDLSLAMKLYRDASKKAPRDPTPWIGLGDTMVSARLLDQATEAYDNALNLEPASPGVKLGMARIHLMLEQAPEARALLEEVQETQPENWRIYNSLGVSEDLAKNHARAQDYYLQALDFSPRNLSVLTNYSLSLALEGNYADAISLLEDVIEEPSATARHRQNLALVYGLAGSENNAKQMARRDLSDRDVENNMNFYRFIRGMTNGSAGEFIPRQYDGGLDSQSGEESGLSETERQKMKQAMDSYFQ